MEIITLTLDRIAHGGKAFGKLRAKPVFVAGGLPGEKVRARVIKQGRVLEAVLVEVVEASPDRVAARCEPSDIEIADFQHVRYAVQLKLKEAIVRDQFMRMARLNDIALREIRPNPHPWHYRLSTKLSPTRDGGLGYFSRQVGAVVPAQACAVLHPTLQAIVDDIDFDLSDLIKLTVRVGSDGAGQLVFAMRDAEPPQISADFPVSVALVMPDGVAATLFGDPFLDEQINGHSFRVGAGSYFYPSIAGAEMVVNSVLELAQLGKCEQVIDCFSGVGVLTKALGEISAELIGIEKNPDAIEDASVNLEESNNIALYNDWAENALPAITMQPDLIVLDSDGQPLSNDLGNALLAKQPPRIIYSSPNLTATTQDARNFAAAGYKLIHLHALDTLPQTHQIHTVGLWVRGKGKRK
ncbi:MAG TPA: class I SAM-dependent RNA methyltransferase [Anaerolineae bacterium]|nr:class I SAM-dependent RNA methyltransferase [Anaerolineae bacterium]